jgi:hypothetical protein
MILLISGCAEYHGFRYSVKEDVVREMPAGVQKGDAIVVLSEVKSFWRSYEKEIGECISETTNKFSIFSSDDFHKIVLSDLNVPDDYPLQKAIDQIYRDSSILERIESLNIHYIVLITEYKVQMQSESRFADIGFIFGIPLPIYYFDEVREISFNAVIFDVKCKFVTGKVISSVNAGWVLKTAGYWNSPKALADNRACEDFAEEIVNFIIQ